MQNATRGTDAAGSHRPYWPAALASRCDQIRQSLASWSSRKFQKLAHCPWHTMIMAVHAVRSGAQQCIFCCKTPFWLEKSPHNKDRLHRSL